MLQRLSLSILYTRDVVFECEGERSGCDAMSLSPMEQTAAGSALLKGTASDDRHATRHRKRHHQQTLPVHGQGKWHNGPLTNYWSQLKPLSKSNTVLPFAKEYNLYMNITEVVQTLRMTTKVRTDPCPHCIRL